MQHHESKNRKYSAKLSPMGEFSSKILSAGKKSQNEPIQT